MSTKWLPLVEKIRKDADGAFGVEILFASDGHNHCRFISYNYYAVYAEGHADTMQQAVENCMEAWRLRSEPAQEDISTLFPKDKSK